MGEADDVLSGGPPGPGASGTVEAPERPAARRTPRVSAEGTVRLRCEGRRGIHTGFVRDLSSGGMFLRIIDAEPPGKRLPFELWLPGMRFPVRGVGEVAWVRSSYEGPGRPPGMALRFVALEAEGIRRVGALLPEGAPVVEVLELPPLPSPPLKPRSRVRYAAKPVVAVPIPQPVALAPAPVVHLGQDASAASLEAFDEALSEPMIFVPPPPLPEVVLPTELPLAAEEEEDRPSPLRWGAAAAGIAAAGALATLVVVGAARREALPAPAAEPYDLARGVVTAPLSAATEAAPPTVEEPKALPLPAPIPAASDRSSARRVTDVRWEPLAAGGTRVVIGFDGPLGAGQWRVSRIGGDTPRLVVRLMGIRGIDAGAPSPWQPDTTEVRRLRAGRHEGDGDGEVHLVLDLASPGVRLVRSTVSAAGDLQLDLAPN